MHRTSEFGNSRLNSTLFKHESPCITRGKQLLHMHGTLRCWRLFGELKPRFQFR